jgi:class 3 adenylate cyclase/tetratricopeptide (TPR) repeat protein
MVDREQVLAAIAAHEQLRGSLPDDVIDVALDALRAQLATIDAAAAPAERRGQASVLFADIAGFTALSDRMDPELVAELMNELWVAVDGAIECHGGQIDKHIGDAVMGVWGATGAREDDPERAVRAALDLRDAFDRFKADHDLDIAVRIGVNTGPVLFGAVGTAGERTATGDAVNVASRVEGLAPHGEVLVSHDTYRHVRGIFDVRPRDPAVVKGKSEPLRTYVVEQAKARAFHLRTRGVEGIETRMVGRDGEMAVLQDAFLGVVTEGTARVVTVVGEPGAGKSRLLDEFAIWLDLRPEVVLYLKGRSVPDHENVPRGLLRELFSYRFEIFDDDPRAEVAVKLRDGLAPLDTRESDVVGQWLGFNLDETDAVRELAGSPDFGTIAEALLTRYLRASLDEDPAVMLLEDVHWADRDSLDSIRQIVEQLPAAPLLVVAVARPTLDQRRPEWGAGPGEAARLDLVPLPDADARELVGQILRLVERVPESLVDLIVASADGNPFYVEELVKMLVEQGVVVVAADGPWSVDLSRLQGLSVPPTLAGVLQARLDALPPEERTAVQHASVVGRTFWDDAVAALLVALGHDGRDVGSTLDGVRRRELVWRQDRSSFSGCAEYRFKHALLRDAAYETVLLRDRRILHDAAAAWMERRAGDRLDEHLASIAEHLALAGHHHRAAEMLERAAEHAAATGGITTACSLYRRCLDCLAAAGDDHGSAATRARVEVARLLEMIGDVTSIQVDLEVAERDAITLGDGNLLALARCCLSRRALATGDVRTAEEQVRAARPLADAAGGRVLAEVLLAEAWVLDVSDDQERAQVPARAALAIADELGHAELEIRSHNQLAMSLARTGGYDEAGAHIDAAVAITRRIGNPVREAMLFSTRGALEHIRATLEGTGDLASAIEHYRRSVELCREHGYQGGLHAALANLAQAEVESGLLDDGARHALECLDAASTRGEGPLVAFAVVVLGQAQIARGDLAGGLAMIGTAVRDERAEGNREELARILATLGLTAADAEPMLAASDSQSLDDVVARLLAESR